MRIDRPRIALRSIRATNLASRKYGTLYIGVTNDLRTRLEQHRSGRGSEFVKKYGVHRLVHVETFASPQEAIAREKQLKNWHRDWKTRLIEEDNPDWSDLSHLL
jgi:putative endonuclease